MRRLIVALALAALPLAPAAADGLDAAQALYEQGRFREAAELARTLDSADGHALAARATLVEAMYLTPEGARLPLVQLAADDARKALEVAPTHVPGHVDLAIALGQVARLQNPVAAHLNGYVGESRRYLERALGLAPDSALARAMFGIWHLEVVRHAGESMAGELYDAREESGVAHCGEAAAMAPGSLVPRYGCAVALLALNAELYGREAVQALTLVTELRAQDAAERLIQERARELLAALGERATYY